MCLDSVCNLIMSASSYAASAQDKKNGVLRMRRKITNKDVETYAHHMSKEEVKLQKVEDLVFKKSLLMGASGTTDCTLMQEVGIAI